MVDAPGSIGKYRVLKHLATGGMGEVFLARQDGPRGFAKLVVIKRLLPQYARDPGFLEMFLNEARLAAQLHHPNIVQVFDLGEEAGLFYLAMEYVHGATLRAIRQKLAERQVPVDPLLAAALVAQGLHGLHHAHTLTDDAGHLLRIVHRDVSPDNLLVGFDGAVKVVDFGIAKATAGASTTTTGTVKGKFAYMAPEYLAGDPIDGRADVYSMGVVLYELLVGARPFRGNSDPALIMAIMRDAPAPVREKAAHVPAPLEAIVDRALQKEARHRFQSAQDMAAELERVVAGRMPAGKVQRLLLELFGAEATRRPSVELPAVGPVHPWAAPTEPAPPAQDVATRASPALVRPGPTRLAPELAAPTQAMPALVVEAPEPSPVDVPEVEPEPPAPAQGRRPPVAVLVVALLGAMALGVGGVVLLYGSGTTERVEVTPAPGPVEAVPPKPADAPAAPATPPLAAAPAQPPTPEVAGPSVMGAPTTPAPAQPPTPPEVAGPPVMGAPTTPAPEQPPAPAALTAPPASPTGTPTAAAPMAAKTGLVNVVVMPWAEVRHAGKVLGVTPMDPVELPRGAQTLTLVNSDLGVTRTVQVRVPAGGTTTVKVDLMAE